MTVFVHNADIGTIFELYITDTAGVAINVSTASVKYFYFQNPSGNKMRRTAAFKTTGVDGKLTYTTLLGDIDEVGTWSVQGYVETSLGKFYTEKATFRVYPNLYVAVAP